MDDLGGHHIEYAMIHGGLTRKTIHVPISSDKVVLPHCTKFKHKFSSEELIDGSNMKTEIMRVSIKTIEFQQIIRIIITVYTVKS